MSLEFDAVAAAFLNAEPPDLLAHYTRPPALIEICTRRTLLAGVAANMNDWREQAIAIELCESTLRSSGSHAADSFVRRWREGPREADVVGRGSPGIFTISFSAALDALDQWRAYASDPGSMALVFSRAQIERVGQVSEFRLVPCVYDRNTQRGACDTLVQHFLPRIEASGEEDPTRQDLVWEFHHAVSVLSAVLKDPSFSSEREWRLVSPSRAYWPYDQLEYLPGPRGIRQFLPVSLTSAFESSDDQCTFVIGPNGDVDQMVQVAAGLGRRLGGPDVPVTLRYTDTSFRS